MAKDQDLKDKLLMACVGHEFPLIMAALVMVSGGMIAQHCNGKPKMADRMVKSAAQGMRATIDIVLMPPPQAYDA